jgi:hypothetical protein
LAAAAAAVAAFTAAAAAVAAATDAATVVAIATAAADTALQVCCPHDKRLRSGGNGTCSSRTRIIGGSHSKHSLVVRPRCWQAELHLY